MRANYLKGGYGYGHAKTELFELILNKFSGQRKRYNELMSNQSLIENELSVGEKKAAERANKKLSELRGLLGYK